MNKIISMLVFLALAFTLSAAKEAKKAEVKPAPAAPAPEAPAAAKDAAKPGILVEGFEAEKIPASIKGMTFLASPEGQEQTVDDTVALEINKDPKFIKSGKQSLKVEYKMKPAAEGKFANISLTSKTPMGANNAFSFWVNKVKGKSAVTVTVFDSNWKKGVSQAIPLSDGAKTISLTEADFTTGFKWAGVTTIQIALRGETLMYLDEVRFTGAAK